MTKQTALSVLTFFGLACGLSFAFSKFPPIVFWGTDLQEILPGFGPLLSGLICYKIFNNTPTYSISGTQPLKSWFILLVAAAQTTGHF